MTSNTSYYAGRRITLTSSGNDSSINFTISGTDVNGQAQTDTVTGGNGGTVTTTKYFKTIDSITSSNSTAGTVTAGLALEAINGSLSQYTYYGGDKFDINTLSVAASNAISITSTSNIIDQLGNFSVGSSLDVRAVGRTTGMALTGDVAATDVTIKTGNGPLVLGDRDITSTNGNIFLQGRGLTQGSGSTIQSTGTVTIYGCDYASGTQGNVTMSGLITAANTGTSSVRIDDTLALQLGSIRAGSLGSRGGIRLGTENYEYITGYGNRYLYVNGAISQAAGTKLEIGQLEVRQSSGSTLLTAADNEIRYLGTIKRGGTISIFDKDSESNGLTFNGHMDYWEL